MFGLNIYIPQSVHDQNKDLQLTLGSEWKRKRLFSSSPIYCNNLLRIESSKMLSSNFLKTRTSNNIRKTHFTY